MHTHRHEHTGTGRDRDDISRKYHGYKSHGANENRRQMEERSNERVNEKRKKMEWNEKKIETTKHLFEHLMEYT